MNAVINPQNYAVRIEQIMRSVFQCDRGDIGGLVESDYIRKYPFTAMISTLMYLCDCASIDIVLDFFEKYNFYGQWSIDELLSFESNSKEINGCNYEIEYQSGDEAMQSMTDAFSDIYKQLK